MRSPPKSICIAFNGPPGIGKDTLAYAIADAHQEIHVSALASLIREGAAAHYKDVDFVKLSIDRETKDSVHPDFERFGRFGMTPRQMLINYSEKIIKPQFGQDHFAEQYAKTKADKRISIMTDLGFDVEAECLADVVDVLFVVQLHHPDFDFSKDSRSYVDIERENVIIIKHTVTRGAETRDKYLIQDAITAELEQRYR